MTALDMMPGMEFSHASKRILEYLHHRLGFDLWMVTRTEGDDWIVLATEDHGYDVEAGKVFRWADSFCSEMVKGNGPLVAPCSDLVPAYAAAPIGNQVTIGAYVGVPLTFDDGALFGTMCAIHPQPVSDKITEEQPLIEMLGDVLSRMLRLELRLQVEARRAERAQAQAMRDALTGLYNRRGWDALLAAEESRCQRYGHPACVITLDLDGLKFVNDTHGHAAGDEMIRRTGEALTRAVREQDVVARVGGDEFAILGVECDQLCAESVSQRLQEHLTKAQVRATLGMEMRHPGLGLEKAWQSADEIMCAHKRARPSSRSASRHSSSITGVAQTS